EQTHEDGYGSDDTSHTSSYASPRIALHRGSHLIPAASGPRFREFVPVHAGVGLSDGITQRHRADVHLGYPGAQAQVGRKAGADPFALEGVLQSRGRVTCLALAAREEQQELVAAPADG